MIMFIIITVAPWYPHFYEFNLQVQIAFPDFKPFFIEPPYLVLVQGVSVRHFTFY